MKDVIITESDMDFGPFHTDKCFHIEKCEQYLHIQESVKMVEFVLLQDVGKDSAKLVFVEAKKSFPNPTSHCDFAKNIDDIYTKMINAFHLFMAMHLKRHQISTKELNPLFQQIDLSIADFRFILVINGFDQSWIPQVQEAFNKICIAFRKIWNLRGTVFIVMNDSIAKKHNLIKK